MQHYNFSNAIKKYWRPLTSEERIVKNLLVNDSSLKNPLLPTSEQDTFVRDDASDNCGFNNSLMQETQRTLPPIGRTFSSKIPTMVYLTATGNAIKNSISVPAFMIQFAAIKNMPLTTSGTLLLTLWLASSAANYWIEWNKLKERLKMEFDLAFLLEDTKFNTGTLYFFDISNTDNTSTLYYATLHKDKIEIKSLSSLNNDIQEKLRNAQFSELSEAECETLRKSISNEQKEPLNEQAYRELRAQLAAHHKPTEKADQPLEDGKRIDAWLFWKSFFSVVAPSVTTGALIGYLVAQGEGIEVIVFAEIVFAALNFLKDMVTESVIGVSAHSKATTTHFWNLFSNNLEKGNIKALLDQPYFKYLLCDLFLGCLRNLAPLVIAVTCVKSFSDILSEPLTPYLNEKNFLSMALTMIVFLASFLLYLPTASAYRIFSLAATKQLLEPAIPFNMENSLSDSKNTFYWLIGELLAARYTTIDWPLKHGFSPAFITEILLWSTNIAFISLGYSALVTYLTCATPHCYQQGDGSLLSFFVSPEKLDATYPIPFILAMLVAAVVIIIGTSSKKANILDYLVKRKENLLYLGEADIENQQGAQTLNSPVAASSQNASRDDTRIIRIITLPEPTDAFVVDAESNVTPMTWSTLKNNVEYNNDGKISTIPFATLFGVPQDNSNSRTSILSSPGYESD